MDAIRSTADNAPIPTLSQGSSSSPDLIKILLRWKWLPILGSAIGATLGYLYFVQLSPQYRATAQVQVDAPPKELPISTFDNRVDTRSRGDELVVVRSSTVLRSAVEIGQLTSNRKLSGKTADEIVNMLKEPKTKILEAKLGSKDINSNIIDISVTTEDAELSADIVQAIVAGYEAHINEKVTSYSKEARDVLTKFSEEYGKSKKNAKAELDALRRNPEILWKDGKPVDPAAEKIAKIIDAMSEINGKIKNVEAVIQQIDEGINQKRPFEELLRMALNSTNDVSSRQSVDSNDWNRERDIARNLSSLIEQFESEKVIPLPG